MKDEWTSCRFQVASSKLRALAFNFHPSAFLKRRARGLVARVCASVEDVAHLAYDAFQFFVLRVEVRRDADACAGAVVDDYLAAYQLARGRGRVLDGDGDGAAAALRVVRAGDFEARFLRKPDEELSLPDALRAYRRDAYLVDDFIT